MNTTEQLAVITKKHGLRRISGWQLVPADWQPTVIAVGGLWQKMKMRNALTDWNSWN